MIDKVNFDNNNALFEIKVIANAKNNNIDFSIYPFKLHVNKPAVDNKANKEIINYFKKIFKIKKSDIEIVKGEKNKNKLIKINNISKQYFREKINETNK